MCLYCRCTSLTLTLVLEYNTSLNKLYLLKAFLATHETTQLNWLAKLDTRIIQSVKRLETFEMQEIHKWYKELAKNVFLCVWQALGVNDRGFGIHPFSRYCRVLDGSFVIIFTIQMSGDCYMLKMCIMMQFSCETNLKRLSTLIVKSVLLPVKENISSENIF